MDVTDLALPEIPFIQSLDQQGYSFPQGRAAVIDAALSATTTLLDKADTLLQAAHAEGFTPPQFSLTLAEEISAAERAERDSRAAQALSWTQPTAPLGELSERLAAAAGKSLADLTDHERAILERIESDQASPYLQQQTYAGH